MTNLTPKEKAEELVNKYYTGREPNDNLPLTICWSCAKQCALVAVEEIIYEYIFDDSKYSDRRYKYWKEVKQEIKKL